MSSLDTIKTELKKLLNTANKKTAKADADLTCAIGSLVDGYGSGGGESEPISLQDKTITENGSYNADDGYDGLGNVTVNVNPTLQEKSVTENGDVTPDDGYYGLSKVIVNVENNSDVEIIFVSSAVGIIPHYEKGTAISEFTLTTGTFESTAVGKSVES